MKTCEHCGESFRPKYPTMKLCFECWKEREQAFDLLIEMRDELAWLRIENRRLREQHGIPDEMRRLLRLLCHPDKHNGSSASTRATVWLNALEAQP